MFEKDINIKEEAEKRCSKYFQENCYKENRWADIHDLVAMYLDGYNKANEWYYVKDELPKKFGYFLTALKSNAYKGFVFEVAYFTGNIFIKDGEVSDNAFAWKEIIPPKEIE